MPDDKNSFISLYIGLKLVHFWAQIQKMGPFTQELEEYGALQSRGVEKVFKKVTFLYFTSNYYENTTSSKTIIYQTIEKCALYKHIYFTPFYITSSGHARPNTEKLIFTIKTFFGRSTPFMTNAIAIFWSVVLFWTPNLLFIREKNSAHFFE